MVKVKLEAIVEFEGVLLNGKWRVLFGQQEGKIRDMQVVVTGSDSLPRK